MFFPRVAAWSGTSGSLNLAGLGDDDSRLAKYFVDEPDDLSHLLSAPRVPEDVQEKALSEDVEESCPDSPRCAVLLDQLGPDDR